MKSIYIIIFFLTGFSSYLQSQEVKSEISDFYKAISSDNLTLIDEQLTNINNSSIPEKEAYEGTLLMKKAGLVSRPGEKLSFFKNGRTLLDNAIVKYPTNAEYRFLRLIIQENAPHFLGYYENLDEDSHFISKNVTSLSAGIKAAISEYIKKSKVLTLHD